MVTISFDSCHTRSIFSIPQPPYPSQRTSTLMCKQAGSLSAQAKSPQSRTSSPPSVPMTRSKISRSDETRDGSGQLTVRMRSTFLSVEETVLGWAGGSQKKLWRRRN